MQRVLIPSLLRSLPRSLSTTPQFRFSQSIPSSTFPNSFQKRTMSLSYVATESMYRFIYRDIPFLILNSRDYQTHQVLLAHTHKQSSPETSYSYPETFPSIPLPRKSKSRISKVKLSRHLQTWKQLWKLAEVPSTKSLRLPYVPSFLPITSFQIRLDLLKTTLLYF